MADTAAFAVSSAVMSGMPGLNSDDADLSVFENKSGLAEDLKFLARYFNELFNQ